MINCWICVVPSGIGATMASRASFSTRNSLVTPLPPWICTAWRATVTAVSRAKYLAIAASVSAGTAPLGKGKNLASGPEMQQRLGQMINTFPDPRLDIDDGNQATAAQHRARR